MEKPIAAKCNHAHSAIRIHNSAMIIDAMDMSRNYKGFLGGAVKPYGCLIALFPAGVQNRWRA